MAGAGPLSYRNWTPRARRIARTLDRAEAVVGPLLRRLAPGGPALAVPRAILCVRCDHLGDQLMTTPAYAALRAAFPEARIDVLAAPWGQAALARNPHLDGVRPGVAPWYDRAHGALSGGAQAFRTGLGLRRTPYDWAFDFRGDPRIVLFYLVPAAARRFGFSGIGLERLLTDATPYRRERPILDQALDLAALAGAPAVTRRPVFVPSAEDRREARDALRRAGIPEGASFALLAPGSNRAAARWPAAGFAAVAKRLSAAGLRVGLTGAPAEGPIREEVRSGAGEDLADLATGVSLPTFAALLQEASVLVANDSAPSHLAVAVGCPLVALFGPSDPALTFPYDDRARWVALAGPCDHPRPCWDPACPSDHGFGDIPPDRVASEALRVARPRVVPA
ncbi:MAG TPA: glycosyltransferase family 9 protein [Candidatus Polarisedimenticolaceae bacterium]|nr:glycosyltransferase family 9 protein [Candidatus Polarisedimenticolaceae bacterium]